MEEEIPIENGPVRSVLVVGNTVNFLPVGASKTITFKIGFVTGTQNTSVPVHLAGKINPDTPREMNCEITYNPEGCGSLRGMIYNIKKPVRPMLK